MKRRQKRRVIRFAAAVLTTLLVLDLAAWAAHVRRRKAGMAKLAPIAEQVEIFAQQLAEDDEWIARNSRLAQQYSQHDEFARRIEARGRRHAAHNALVDAYNAQVLRLFRRYYVAPLPAPDPPLEARWEP